MTSSTLPGDGRRTAESSLYQDGLDGGGLPVGLVPVAFAFRQRRVRLLDLSGVDCREYNFRATAERWTAEHPDLAPVEMTWSEYLAAARQTPCAPLGGLVFNVARCGSTLLANMLAALPGAVVLKESITVAMLIRRLLSAQTASERQELADLLTVSLPLYGQLASGPAATPTGDLPTEQPRGCVFVKPHSSLTVGAGTLLDLFPETPAIFLYRNPEAVVASMLAKPPYGGLYESPREEIVPGFPSLAHAPADLSPAGFHAHLWRSPVEIALSLPSERLLLLDYAEIVKEPMSVIERLTRHLGIAVTPETAARMVGILGVYAKDASGQQRFDAAGAHHRPPLDAAQRANVQAVVGDLHRQLTARRRAQP